MSSFHKAFSADVALSCGSLIGIARVTGPQTSHRGELQGAVLVTALAEEGDSLTMGDQAVVLLAPRPPHRECAHMDVTHKLELWPLPFTWIPSHRDMSEATSAEDCGAMMCNRVDKWAKIAAALPTPM